jgi:hypothetical protein
MKKPLTGKRKRELAKQVAALKRELEQLPADRQNAFRELLNGQTRSPDRKPDGKRAQASDRPL